MVYLTIPLDLGTHCDLRYADVRNTGVCVRWRQCASRWLGEGSNRGGQLRLAALTRVRRCFAWTGCPLFGLSAAAQVRGCGICGCVWGSRWVARGSAVCVLFCGAAASVPVAPMCVKMGHGVLFQYYGSPPRVRLGAWVHVRRLFYTGGGPCPVPRCRRRRAT